jgi:uncharacterized membrane protein
VFWVLLVLCPLVTSIGEFQTSKISLALRNNYLFIPFWSNAAVLCLYGPVSAVAVDTPAIDLQTGGLLLLWTCCLLGAMSAKMVAFSLDKVTRVFPIYYFESVYCLLLDCLVFDESFNWVQALGIGLVFSMFGLKLMTTRN